MKNNKIIIPKVDKKDRERIDEGPFPNIPNWYLILFGISLFGLSIVYLFN